MSAEPTPVEVGSRELGKVLEIIEASEAVDECPQYQLGSIQEYPFALDMPEAAGPCLETNQTYVAWRLRAVVKRRMVFDPELHLLLNVYNGA